VANELKLDNPLAKDMKPIKVNDKSTGLLISDSNVFVESQPTEENHVATKKYVDDNAGGGSVALNDLTDVKDLWGFEYDSGRVYDDETKETCPFIEKLQVVV